MDLNYVRLGTAAVLLAARNANPSDPTAFDSVIQLSEMLRSASLIFNVSLPAIVADTA